jgi:hypothetical protein
MNTILVVGKDPKSDTYGFDAIPNTLYGSLIPDSLYGSLVSSLALDESAGSVILTLASGSNDLGDEAHITLISGETIDITGIAGVYTAALPSTAYTDVIIGKLNGVQNMFIGGMSSYVSAETTDANTIVITLDQAINSTAFSTIGDWSVDIDAGTDNPVTSVTLSGTTVTITVENTILTTEVITVSHTRDNYINTLTASAVTNNEV